MNKYKETISKNYKTGADLHLSNAKNDRYIDFLLNKELINKVERKELELFNESIFFFLEVA